MAKQLFTLTDLPSNNDDPNDPNDKQGAALTDASLPDMYRGLQVIFNITDTIYVLMDADLRIISFNPRAAAFARNELGHKIRVSEYFLDYFPADRHPVLLSYMLEVLRGRPLHYEISYPQRDGSCHWYFVRWFPISNGDDKPSGLMMAVSDITDKKILEQRLDDERLRKQREITEAVIIAEEKERHSIGLELHDNVNQLLTAAQLYLGMVKSTGELTDLSVVNRIDKLIGDAIGEIRNLSHAMIPPLVEESGLTESIHYLVDTLSKATPLAIQTEIRIDENRMEANQKLGIYRIIQEQFSNIVKHANARTVTLQLLQDTENLTLHIADDGIGFDMSGKRKGVGLLNIRTRASLMNGEATISSAPGEGCVVQVCFK